ncbi:MAG TPA: adenosylcobinamide-GDP ribazoletransferase, partial [Massilia sp.]|nr:adenosylcobinamide-GDP ribazoletransferase [Massilia sp.]
MKDSRVGAYGAIGIVCMLGVKCTALAMLPPTAAIAALFLAHPLSRLAATSLIWRMDYARDQGKAKPMAQQMHNGEFAIAAITALLPGAVLVATGLLAFTWLAACIAAAALVAFWLARKFQARLQGYTGDCLGAVQQLAEVAVYLVVVASLGHAAIA